MLLVHLSGRLLRQRHDDRLRDPDCTILEVFEWRSAGAIQQAHANPAVHVLWAEFAAACDYTPLAKLAEAQQMFAEFEAVQL